MISTIMIALLDVTKNNYDLYDYCESTSHCALVFIIVIVSMGCLGLLEEVSYFYYFNLCDFHSYKKIAKS